MNYKILMVDDDRELLKMLNQYFTLKNYTVMIAENGIEAMEKISANPDIILLDVNMPGMDGIEVCRRIRDMVSCPIIFLTAKVEEQDRVMGLLSGGDDYVLKPFSLKELDARIIAHLKREERLHRKKEQRFYGELVIDYASKCVHIKGNALELTKLEYEIIEFLSMNPEMVFDKEKKAVDWIFRYGNEALATLEKLPLDKMIGNSFSSLFSNMDAKWLHDYERATLYGETLEIMDYSPEIDTNLKIICFPTFPGHCGCILFNADKMRYIMDGNNLGRWVIVSMKSDFAK